MSTVTSKEIPMEIDIMHALEDFLDAYDNHAVMIVTEAVANAIDVGANRINTEISGELEEHLWVSFHNDGPAMNEEQFKKYHKLASSTKTKGKGIGFAGIGAKVYLAAWKDTIIHTETTDGNEAFASDMLVRGNELVMRHCKPAIKKLGTFYKVNLKPEDHSYLASNMKSSIEDAFDPAIFAGLSISINGNAVTTWDPPHEFRKKSSVKSGGMKFPILLRVTADDIPAQKRVIQYHVTGKIIKTKEPAWIGDAKPAFQKKIHAYVDATAISDRLNLNKTEFKSGTKVSQLFKAVDSHIFKVLKAAGYVEIKEPKTSEHNQLTKFFDKLFKNPKYDFLNPDVTGGRGLGKGDGEGGSKGKNSRRGSSKGAPKESGSSRPKGGGGLKIVYVTSSGDSREGWLDPETNQLVVNMAHPLFIKYESNIPARNQKVCHILTSVLITNSLSKKPMTAGEAFELQTELLTLAKDVMW